MRKTNTNAFPGVEPGHALMGRGGALRTFGGLALLLVMALLAASTVYASPFMLAPCIAVYVWSTWWYGRIFE